jgi:hypothetical protein
MSERAYSLRDEFERKLSEGADPSEVVSDAIARAERFQQLWLAAEERWRDGVGKPWTDEINRLRDLLRADPEDAERMRQSLILHYGENVMPASHYCQAFFDWRDAMAANGVMPEAVEALNALYLPIMKSNYLARRIYGGEPHRTEPCPIHKGRWSGCYAPDSPDGSCACVTNGNTTGWLPVTEGERDGE